ncbi:TPA: DnaJ domain-containing protein [Klebsiella pneumoniae subsp. pneumoniae]|nr:DnaJ domain-containing protein [Klebsiella pneumoniae subsp. pneumoniae]
MNVQEALNVFGLSGELTEQDIRKAYKQAALKYHPDKNRENPLAAEMMKAINAAHDFLLANIDKINQYQSTDESARYHYGEELENVLNALLAMSGVVFEVAGNWIWISGDTRTHKDAIKALGCKWASKKKMWFYRPEEHRSRWNRKEHSMDEIREMYGTTGQRRATGFQKVENHA